MWFCAGGMQQNIYDSMAEGVTNADCIVCFMNKSYEESEKYICSLCLRCVVA
eukprot:SAG31_NODE_1886_length_6989_cov_6.914514_2_plen_52_part_00